MLTTHMADCKTVSSPREPSASAGVQRAVCAGPMVHATPGTGVRPRALSWYCPLVTEVVEAEPPGAQHPRYRRALKDVAARGHTAQSAGHTSSAQLRPLWLSKRSRLLVKDLLSQSVRQVAVPQGDQEGYEPAGWRAATAWASRGARPWAPWGHGFSRGPVTRS